MAGRLSAGGGGGVEIGSAESAGRQRGEESGLEWIVPDGKLIITGRWSRMKYG
jgi:hypothetical protein